MKKTKTKSNIWTLLKFGIGAVIGVISIIIALGLAGAVSYFVGGLMLHTVTPYAEAAFRAFILR